MPERVQLSRRKGWRKPPNTVNVARPSKWGNPYHLDLFGGDRALVVRTFRAFLAHPNGADLAAAARKQLRGKNLACWCPLDQPCHADVLLEVANESVKN